MDKEKYYNTIFEEQEIVIIASFSDKQLTLFTSKPSHIQKMLILLGEPTKINYIDGKIVDGRWDFGFDDKRANIIFSKGKMIGYHKIKK